MKFKSDSHRKAVFANMFSSGSSGRTSVNSSSVTNFEVKSSRTSKMENLSIIKYPRMSVRLKEEKVKVKVGTKLSCEDCKRKGLRLTSGKCSHCIKERKEFKPQKSKHPLEWAKAVNRLMETHHQISGQWIPDKDEVNSTIKGHAWENSSISDRKEFEQDYFEHDAYNDFFAVMFKDQEIAMIQNKIGDRFVLFKSSDNQGFFDVMEQDYVLSRWKFHPMTLTQGTQYFTMIFSNEEYLYKDFLQLKVRGRRIAIS